MLPHEKQDEYTIHLFYRKKDKTLYAYTIDKKLAHNFMEERNMKVFRHVKKKILDDEFSIFSAKNHQLQLEDIIVSDIHGSYTLAGTQLEDSYVTTACDTITQSLSIVRTSFLLNARMQEPYSKWILQASTIATIQDPEFMQVDTLKLFYYIFRFSFIGEEENEYLLNQESPDKKELPIEPYF